MITIGCLWVPSQVFTARYVRILRDAVARNLTVPHEFVCLTNFPDFIPGIKTRRLVHHGWAGCWPMIELFRPGLFNGDVLYFDLDTFIIENIDFLAEPYDGPLMGLDDFYFKGKYASGIMRWRQNGATVAVYESLAALGEYERVHGLKFQDEAYTSMVLKGLGITPDNFQERWPGKIISYKAHYRNTNSVGDASIVCCHGVPKPHQITEPELRRHWI